MTTNARFLSEDLDFKSRYGECRFLLQMFRLQIDRHTLLWRRRSICHWPSLWLSICSLCMMKKTEKNGCSSSSSSSWAQLVTSWWVMLC